MTEAEARQSVLRHRAGAVVLLRLAGDRPQYRVSPRVLRCEGDVPRGGFLSSWCSTEARAWIAAAIRTGRRRYREL